ncbi:MAG: DUF5989 family protein [Cyanobacteriota bacterium]|nr:DUF5989 family protein [Cyanobacteriota bacterium]
MEFLKDLSGFLKDRQKYWLVPLIITLLSVGGLMIFAQSSILAPFIYTLF